MGDDSMHPSRKRARDERSHKTKPRKAVDLENNTAIKKRARAIERLLAHDPEKLPAHKKRELERELAAHKRRIADAQYKKIRSKMISKYHMVRFFGRLFSLSIVYFNILIDYCRTEKGHQDCKATREEAGASDE